VMISAVLCMHTFNQRLLLIFPMGSRLNVAGMADMVQLIPMGAWLVCWRHSGTGIISLFASG
jgi:hypothetical protein